MSKLRKLDAMDGARQPLGVFVELGQQSGLTSGSFGFATMTAEVVGENRTLNASGGSSTDSFAAEYTHHVYRIKQ